MKSMIPTLTLSTDLICGFCGETEEQFQDVIFYGNVDTELVGNSQVRECFSVHVLNAREDACT